MHGTTLIYHFAITLHAVCYHTP